MHPLMMMPPHSTLEPVTEIFHGVSVTDPYRWLEDQDSPCTRSWIEEQTRYARAYLDAIPGRERIRRRVEELLAVEIVSEPWKVGNRYFFLKRAAAQERPVIMMRESVAGEDIPLIDPAGRDEGGTLAVGILDISRDGRYLAYSVRYGGEDSCAVEFFDVCRGVTLPDRLPHGLCRGLAFAPDGSGFYYVHGAIGTPRPHFRAVNRHTFGTELEEDSEIFSIAQNPKHHLAMFASPDGLALGYLVFSLEDPRTVDFYVHALASEKTPRRVVERMEGVFSPQFAGDKLIALTDWNSPNGRIVLIDPGQPQRDTWSEIVPETKARIQSFAIVGSLIFVGSIENATSRIDTFDFSGKHCGTLPCPAHGTPRILPSRGDRDTLFYSFTSFSHPPMILSYATPTGEQEVWSESKVPFSPASIEVEQVEYASKDGTRVPMFLVAQKGRRRSSPLPVFLTGYGGFGISVTPQFTAHATFLIERGFLVAVANLRGGSEFGEQWHLAGKRHNRQNAIDDFIAAAEWLITHGHAATDRIAIGGGSNAGLLVGAALTQRPELYRAVVCLGPLLDMLRYHKFDQANFWVEEYGCAESEDDFPYLHSYSPYHQVENGTAYPSVMLITGDADTRCNPLHARKMAARLQAGTSSGHPILLDHKPTWGHTPVQPLSTRIEALTDRLAFICHELGVSV
jgi:prolyl oligopeptidase